MTRVTPSVRADIEISDAGVLAIDIIVPKGHRADGLTFLERVGPFVRILDNSLRAPAAPSGAPATSQEEHPRR